MLLALAGGYLALCGAARLLYPRALFPAPRVDGTPPIDDPNAKLVTLGTTVGIHWAAPPHARTIVLFHGNGETIFNNVSLATELHRRGVGVLLVEYRGYGTLHGRPPSEAMLYEDGESAIGWLAREHGGDNEKLIVLGWSLGSSIAAEMAYRGHGSRLVLVAPFTSIRAMGRRCTLSAHVSAHEPPARHAAEGAAHQAADARAPRRRRRAHSDHDGRRGRGRDPERELVRVARGHHPDLFWPGSGTSPDAATLLDLVTSPDPA